jgi:prepilin-type N-terminal cleavage/methylation domain-containing protein
MKRNVKNFSFLNSHFSTPRGFTLIELLTVIGIFAIIGTLAVSILSLTLRGTKKSDLLVAVRGSGNTTLSQIVKNIRYAKRLNAPTSCVPSVNVSSVTITSPSDDGMIVYACSTGIISSNSASLIDTNSFTVTGCSFTCSQKTINDPPTITLQFSLMPKNANALPETNASIPFQASVTLRNFNR